jgi:hypothetical protein
VSLFGYTFFGQCAANNAVLPMTTKLMVLQRPTETLQMITQLDLIHYLAR